MKRSRSNNLWKFILVGAIMFGIGAVVGGVTGVFIFLRITGGSAEISEPISAPTLSLDSVATPTTFIEKDPTQAASQPTATVEQSVQLFRIVSEESEARFSVYETYPEGTAVGRTNQIAGDIIIDFNDPANSQLGTVRINLRSLQTDDPDRDRSIRCCVLLTSQDAYEFTNFVPTAITGLPSTVEMGQTIPFQVTGDLTLRGNTRPVTFDVAVTLISPDVIQGTATTVVNRTDFGILNDEQNGFDYHGVEDNVTLEFDFTARAVEE